MVRGSRAPVVFGAASNGALADASAATADFNDQAKLNARAERFRTVQEDPTRQSSATAPVQTDISNGLDLLSEAEVKKRQERANRFNTTLVEGGRLPGLAGKEVDQYEQRRQTALTAERRPDTVHLHGMAMMSEEDCLRFFARFDVLHIDSVNDNSCNVVFRSSESASNAIRASGILADPQEAPDGFGFTQADISNELHLWHKGRGSYQSDIGEIPVTLFFRVATIIDANKAAQKKQALTQSQGRGKKAHRGKGKGRGRGQQQQQQQQQRKRQYEDMDGDVSMDIRGERGGKKAQRRKRRALGLEDTMMQEAEVYEDADYHPTNAQLRQAAANGSMSMADLAGPQTMFSASAAGHALVPTLQHYAAVPSQDVRQTQLLDYGDV